MVFTTTTLFKGIACPYGESCALTNCIFNHDLRPKETRSAETSVTQPVRHGNPESEAPATKRRKVAYEDASQKPPTKADRLRSDIALARQACSARSEDNSHSPSRDLTKYGTWTQPRSLARPVSPPAINAKYVTSRQTSDRPDNSGGKHGNKNSSPARPSVSVESELQEALNPRLIANDPAGHNKRSLYLKHLHAEMARLNTMVMQSTTLEHKHLLVLAEQQLVKMALDEEEKVAKDQPAVYANVIKTHIARYKKMNVTDWTEQVKATLIRETSNISTGDKAGKPVQTDLTPKEELQVLPHLVADQTNLPPFGYITKPPTEAQATEAAAAVSASRNWEICDRCSSRFQVFPERNEAGLLASNGPCKHHPNKKIYPVKNKGDVAMGHQKEPYYPCCNNVVGSPGCTEKEYHVFKASTAGRLAAVLPFITTPENATPANDAVGQDVHAVSFDCEMGYTVYGMELIRLTAVSWPEGKELVDVLVRPLGTVIDLNSRFSGVWPEQFTNAVEYETWCRSADSSSATDALPIVSSPAEARKLLCSFLTPTTPLIGHAIDNDLNAVRLCHPAIVDTVLLFPHPRGLPMRFGLKMLASKYLGWSIQSGGESGHDSKEDARATGELVRFKVGERWRVMKAEGWVFGKDRLVQPPERRNGEAGGMESEVKMDVVATAAGKKRRKKWSGGDDGKADESTEDEEVESAVGSAEVVNKSAN